MLNKSGWGGRAEIQSAYEIHKIPIRIITKQLKTSKVEVCYVPVSSQHDFDRGEKRCISLIEIGGTNEKCQYGLAIPKNKTISVSVRGDQEIIAKKQIMPEGEIIDQFCYKKVIIRVNNKIIKTPIIFDDKTIGQLCNKYSHAEPINPCIMSKVYNDFLHEHDEVKMNVQNILDDLLLSESHHPSIPGLGISLAAESPYNPQNICVNMERTGYLRNYFGMDDLNRQTKDPNTLFRAMYGTGCGTVTSGIPDW